MIVSFISLALNSTKLYFSQRIGKFLTVAPTIPMTLYVIPAITLQLLMPLFSLVIMAAYLKGFVLLAILAVVTANAIVLSVPCWKKRLISRTRQVWIILLVLNIRLFVVDSKTAQSNLD